MRRQDPDTDYPTDRDHKYFRWKEDLCAFIDDYWEYLHPGKQKSATWHNTIASVLSTNSSIFLSGFEKFQQPAWWTLKEYAPPSKILPKGKQAKPSSTTKSKRKTDEDAPPKRAYRKRSAVPHLETKEESDLDDFLPAKSVRKSKKAKTVQPSRATRIGKPNKKTGVPERERLHSESSDLSSENELTYASSDMETSRISAEPFETAKTYGRTLEDEKDDGLRHPSPGAIEARVKYEDEPIETGRTRALIRKECESNIESQLSGSIRDMLSPTNEPDIGTPQPKKPKAPRLFYGLSPMSQQQEWVVLQKLDRTTKALPAQVARLRRKLHLRRLKRSQGVKVFDLDSYLNSHFRSHQQLSGMPSEQPKAFAKPAKKESEKPLSNQIEEEFEKLKSITHTPYASSFASRLYGTPRCHNTITKFTPWLSPWNGRKLRPYIRRDFESKPVAMRLLHEIRAAAGKPQKTKSPIGISSDKLDYDSIDYVYFQKEHLEQVNRILCRTFWDGVDVGESLLFPEFSIVALYKRYVVGCAFMTPEAYVTYITVVPGWEKAGIGQFLLYHLFQTAISKDITLHVSANSPAMILYQKFGFKPEEFVINFYDKYLSPESSYSKNAFFLRLRR
ncbi:hypothetical protein VKS41_008504 [Umbelopsis sp. WA50703]